MTFTFTTARPHRNLTDAEAKELFGQTEGTHSQARWEAWCELVWRGIDPLTFGTLRIPSRARYIRAYSDPQ